MAGGAQPRVTVLMAVRNGERHVPAAARSILAQTLEDFEFLIVDDGSADGTGGILADLERGDARVRVLRQAPAGLTVSLNRGLDLARGEYLARMDADDLARPERLARQAAFLDAHPGVVAVGCQVELIDEWDRPIGPLEMPLGHEDIDGAHIRGLAGRLIHPAAMLRTSALREVGGYRATFETSQDYDLWLRLAEIGRLANLPDTLLAFRQHAGSVSGQRRQRQARDVFAIWTEACRRRGLEVPAELPPAQSGWLKASDQDQREWWVTLAIAHGHFRTAWAHALALVRSRPSRPHAWWVLHRVVRMWLRSTPPGAALARWRRS